MSKTLTLELPDEVYEATREAAQASGQSTEAAVAAWLRERVEENSSSPRGIEEFFGAWESDDSHSADNDRIDADLAREYGRGL
jgi:hypothetical protein